MAVLVPACTAINGGRAAGEPAGKERAEARDRKENSGAVDREILMAFWEEQTDYGLALFRMERYRSRVVDFYTRETGSAEIARLILQYSDKYEIPPALAFSLAWTESRYNPRAVNQNASSTDRGLFQLNSRSFPDLAEEEFFNLDKNSRLGLEYLRGCLDAGETEIVALAMYNAGRARVSGRGTPLMTLEYISRILDYREALDTRFTAFCLKGQVEKTGGDKRKLPPQTVDRKKGIK